MDIRIRDFFAQSDMLDYAVLRPLSHLNLCWELIWDGEGYVDEEYTFSGILIRLIDRMASVTPPKKYHDNEDILAESVIASLKWKIEKVGNRWVGADYASILEQGSLATAGRVAAAIKHGQHRFDDMEDGHQTILAAALSILVFCEVTEL
ncbi:hypothetical protein [Pseudomonas putida]|jgi:hypothetical protein|uniref:hypothetical protein n=1 Tax=Pseudomonas putida TaxID=303 RepID=UPI0009B737CE|nr:hypothetical protein [Pseudomonas putida]HDS1810215.1 hypothetical protein [Pseudomonas putida]HDS3807059.1 hypothetical protein [Pseudomonas putida]